MECEERGDWIAGSFCLHGNELGELFKAGEIFFLQSLGGSTMRLTIQAVCLSISDFLCSCLRCLSLLRGAWPADKCLRNQRSFSVFQHPLTGF